MCLSLPLLDRSVHHHARGPMRNHHHKARVPTSLAIDCSPLGMGVATDRATRSMLPRAYARDNATDLRGRIFITSTTTTMIHSGTLCIQRKVTKFPCFGVLVFRAQFQDFLSAFWRSFFAMQLALVSMITITPTLSLSVFSLQRTRLFPTCGELWRTCGELWLYFEMQRRLELWSFSWSSRRSREAQK